MIEQFFSSLFNTRYKIIFFSLFFCFALFVLGLVVYAKIFAPSYIKSDNHVGKPGVLAETDKRKSLFGDISFNVPALFNEKVTFNEDVKINNKNLDLGTGSISASNIIYSLRPGANISITGDRQNPTISASISGSFVTSLQGQSGAVAFVEGEGITIDGLTITNSDPGSAQNIFKTVSVEGSSITAGSNNDTLELAAGTGISLSTDGNKVTITNSSPASGGGGSSGNIAVTQDGTTVVTALTTLDFAGSDFTVTQSPTGEANITTVLGSTINLASSEVTGVLPIANGGTGATTLANLIALGTDTTGSYVSTVTGGSGISIVGGGPGEGLTPTVSLGALSANWDQTGAFDIVLNNASSELQILESVGGTFYGTIDVGNLSANRTYTFPDGAGTVCILELGNCGGGGGGNISGSGTSGQITFFNGASTITSETTGFSWDATNKRLGLGTDTPGGKLHVEGASSGQALALFNETGDQNILTASASGTTRLVLDRTGNLNIIGGAYQIGGTNVLTGTTLGAGVINSSLTTVGTLSSGSIASGFGTITTNNMITGTTINGTTGINTGAGVGTQRIDASGNLTNIAGVSSSLNPTAVNTYNLGTGTGNQYNSIYGNTIFQNGNQVCDLSNNCGSLTTTYWDQLNGALRPKNSTVDLLVGGQSSESAKFAILNVNSGTPTASVSGTNGAAYIAANGTLQTTANQTLTLGGNTTGNITLSPQNGSGTVFNTGTMNLANGKTYQINGTDVLSGTTLGAGVLNSSLTSVGALASGSIGNGFGTIATTNTITGTTLNGTTGLNTGAGAGTQRIDSTGNLLNIGTIDSTYLDTSTNLVNLAASTVLQFNGTTVIDASRNLNNIAGVTTSLTPTSANTYNLGTGTGNQYNAIYGNTIFQNGNQVCDASGNCAGGAGGTKWQRNGNVIAPLTVTDLVVLGGDTSTQFQFEVNGKITGKSLVSLNETGDQNILTASASGTTVFSLNRNGNLQFTGNSAALNTLTSTATTARTYTLPDGTGTVCLVELGNCAGSGGGITGSGTSGQISFFNGSNSITSETSGFTWDATNDRLGIGTNTPDGKVQVTGANTGKALAIFNETGNQDILTASASGTSMLNLDRSGNLAIEGMLSDLSGAALTINDNLNLISGNAFQIDGTNVLSGTTLGAGVTSSSLTTVGTLTSGTWNASVIGAAYGGTGLNTSAMTGVPTIASGTWSVSSALSAALGGTGDDTSGTTGVPYISNGNWQYEAQVSTARGGTGLNTSGATNGQLLIGNGSGFSLANLTAGSGINISNGSGTITISQSGAGASKWTQNDVQGILTPNISNLDVLFGGTATSSAKFGILNMAGGTPTASLSAGAAGGTYLTANGLLQTTANQTLTLGGTTTGNIILSPQNGAGTVMSTGTMNLATGKTYQIDGVDVLSGTTLGSGVINSSLTSVGVLNGGSIISGFGTIDTGDTITGTTLNGTTGINTGATGGTQRIDSSGNLVNIGTIDSTYLDTSTNLVNLAASTVLQFNGTTVIDASRNLNNVNGVSTSLNPTSANTYNLGTGTGNQYNTIYGNTIFQNGNQVCDTSNNCGIVTYWDQLNGALRPKNSTVDLLIGGQATGSAKFAVLNVNSGTPTASVSAGTAGGAYLTADGKLATTARQTLTLGDSTTTGDVSINPAGNVLVGSGALDRLGAGISVRGGAADQYVAEFYGRDAGFAGFGIFAEANGATPFLQFGDNAGSSGTPTADWTLTTTSSAFDFRPGNAVTSSVFNIASNGNLTAAGTLTGLTGLTSSGTIRFSSLTTDGGILYTNGTGTVAQTTAGSAGQCLTSSGGGAPTWSTCAAGSNYWQLNNGALSPFSNTADLLVGGTATSSAKFAFMNVNSGTPTASISAITTNNALTLDASGNIGTTNRQSLTIGTSTTGNITIGNGTTPVSLICGSNNDCNLAADASQHNTAIGGLNGFSATTVQAGLSGMHLYSTGNIDMALFSSGTGLGIGPLNAPIRATLDVKGMSGTTPTASISGQTSNATMVVDNSGVGDLFTASSSGMSRFTIANNGNIAAGGSITGLTGLTSSGAINFTGLTTNGGILYTNGTGTVAQTTAGSAGQCLTSNGGGAPTWSSCAASNYWQLNNGVLSPFSNTLDLLVGGTSTSSAKFAVTNMTGSGTPTASVSAGAVGAAYLDATGKLATTAKQTLTLGDSTTTGNIIMNPGGLIGVGTTSLTGNYMTVQSNSDSNNTLVLRNRSTQSADVFKVVNSNDDDMFVIDTFGGLDLPLGQANFGRSVGIGTPASAGQMLRILTDDPASMGLSLQAQNGQTADLLNVLDASLNVLFAFDEAGNLRIGAGAATADTGKLNITGAFTGKALAILNETGNQDIFTASSAGTTRFTIGNNGNLAATGTLTGLTGLTSSGTIQFSGFTNNGGLLYTNGTGTVAQTAVGSNGQCLQSAGGGSPVWASCGNANYWQLTNGTVSPFSNTLDLLVGGTATGSAKFAVTGINGGTTPFASVSATTASGGSGNGVTLGGDGTIQSLRNNTLTLGGDTTGNIALMPRNGSGNVGIGTTSPTSKLHISGTGTLFSAQNGSSSFYTDALGVNIDRNSATCGSEYKLLNQGTGYWSMRNSDNDCTGGTLGTYYLIDQNNNERLSLTQAGTLGLGTALNNHLATLDVRGVSGTLPVASISGQTSNAALMVDNKGVGDIFTASSSGLNRFVIAQNGDVGIGKRPALDSGPSGATITSTGSAQFTSISGMGLTDCDGQDDKLLWDAQTKTFSCGADRASVQIRKSSDQTRASNTFIDDTQLTFSIGANETWVVHLLINATTTASSGFRYQITAPTGATCNITNFSMDNASDFGVDINQGCNTSIAYGAVNGAQTLYYDIDLSISNGANAGSITLQFANNGSGTATVKAGSSMYGFKATGADLAEIYYSKDRTVNAGDVVMVDDSIKAGVQKTNKAYDSRTLGIVSTQPGLVLGDATPPQGKSVLLALNGRVPVKIASNSAAIKAGDILTTSDVPGRAMKATKAGQTIAKALEDWNPGTGQQTVMAFVNLSSYDPDDDVTDVDDLTLASDPNNQSGRYRVTDSTGATIAKVGRFSDIAVGNMKAGNIDAQKFTINGIDIFDLFKSKDAGSNDPALPDGMEMKFADLTDRLDALEQKVASNEAKTETAIENLKKTIEEKSFGLASQSAELQSLLGKLDVKDAMISDTLNVLGRTTVNDLGVIGNFTAGVLSINGLDDDGNASINTLNGDLKLQSAGVGGIDILAGKIMIDKDGQMTIKESLTAKTINTTKLNIVPDTTSTPSAVLSTSAGSVVIEAGKKSIEVSTTALTQKSLIFATPDQPVAIGSKPKDKDTFIIQLPETQEKDVKVNWWIVN